MDKGQHTSSLSLPSCVAEYAEPVLAIDGSEKKTPFGNLYCAPYGELKFPVPRSSLLDDLKEALKPFEPIQNLVMSAEYFESKVFSSWLKTISLAKDFQITILSQKFLTGRPHLDPDFLLDLRSITSNVQVYEIGCDVFDQNGSNNCPKDATNTHHVKMAIFRSSMGSVNLVGSGNFTAESMLVNVEDWSIFVMLQSKNPTVFDCIASFLIELSNKPLMTYKEQRNYFESISKEADYPEQFELYLLPFMYREFVDRIEEEISRSKRVLIVAQFLESERIFNAIRSHPNVQFNIALDDAYFYSYVTGNSLNFITVENAKAVLMLNALPNVSLHFLQTNHHFSAHGQTNTVHARSFSFETETGKRTYMLGSAHLRDGAFRLNTEVQVFLSGSYANEKEADLQQVFRRSVVVTKLSPRDVSAISKGMIDSVGDT